MTVAVLVLAHRGPAQVAKLVNALDDPDMRVYLHLDQRIDASPFRAALEEVSGTHPIWLERRPTPWGGAEVIDVVLDALARAREDGCGYFMVVSGQDFPLRGAEEIVHFAEAAGDRSYMEHWPLPYEGWRFGGRDRIEFYSFDVRGRRETCIPRGEDTSGFNAKGRLLNNLLRLRTSRLPKRSFPSYARPYGGWSWWNLSAPAIDHVLAFTAAHPDYRRYHEHTLSADEVFFQSIVLGTGYAEEHEVVNDSLRFTRWLPGTSHPETLTVADLPALAASDALFARKFDAAVDADVLDRLAERVAP